MRTPVVYDGLAECVVPIAHRVGGIHYEIKVGARVDMDAAVILCDLLGLDVAECFVAAEGCPMLVSIGLAPEDVPDATEVCIDVAAINAELLGSK